MAELVNALSHIQEWPGNVVWNVKATWATLTSTTLLRIILIIGGYLLIRPLIVKFFAWTYFRSENSKRVLNAGMQKNVDSWGEGLVSANDLRSKNGGIDTEQVRKRTQGREEEMRRKIEKGEIRQDEMFDLLVDYEQGKEGW